MKRLFSRNSKPLEKTRFISELNTRCLLSISGKDFLTVLQGLFSNNIDYSNSSSSAIFGFFLNKEGQVISDAIISRPNVLFNNSISARINEVFIECSKDVCKALFYHLKRHSMRRKVDISILPGFRIYAIYSPYASQMDNKKPGSSWDMFYDKTPQSEVFLSDEKESDFLYVDSCFVDPRLPSLGMRIYSGDPTMDYIETVMKDNDDIEMTSNGIYNFLRILNSVPEGSETYGWFPHNVNGDFLNGVFVRKGGGFLGQEKVARTIHNEVVQKRPMPFLIKNTHDSNLKWSKLTSCFQAFKLNSFAGNPFEGNQPDKIKRLETEAPFEDGKREKYWRFDRPVSQLGADDG